ncbi:hypothetical protein AVEN_150584-1 [Araneus ventricosus]|uniref:Uncharacterized protein n=1 Tax=Araneus ventricosus TaxID=182803 RepID=A0A4Y2S806_ARAVE|nr:hypothetical protein AVEN_150584-1 [Araneus ventricosus]
MYVGMVHAKYDVEGETSLRWCGAEDSKGGHQLKPVLARPALNLFAWAQYFENDFVWRLFQNVHFSRGQDNFATRFEKRGGHESSLKTVSDKRKRFLLIAKHLRLSLKVHRLGKLMFLDTKQ